MTAAVMKFMEATAWGENPDRDTPLNKAKPAVDVAGKLRGMWA